VNQYTGSTEKTAQK